jgi:hypothetical protein
MQSHPHVRPATLGAVLGSHLAAIDGIWRGGNLMQYAAVGGGIVRAAAALLRRTDQ